jgi:hypothetical protein
LLITSLWGRPSGSHLIYTHNIETSFFLTTVYIFYRCTGSKVPDDHLHMSAGFGMKGVVVTAGQIKVSPYGRITGHFMGHELRQNVCASELKLAFYAQFQIPLQVYEDDCRHRYD